MEISVPKSPEKCFLKISKTGCMWQYAQTSSIKTTTVFTWSIVETTALTAKSNKPMNAIVLIFAKRLTILQNGIHPECDTKLPISQNDTNVYCKTG